ncbi:MAG: hypothetical protein KatS3mg095_0365 [Candidatus Parcubacteria bacterium]|nr:MAG: hypothetical protein KatS3mg095_0365 [Candidatus Parcubacteria bacterium]
MNKKNIKRKIKKSNPSFGWSLILFFVVILEFVLLIQERAWSQNYVEVVDRLRDQADNLSLENQKIFGDLYNFYNQIFLVDKNNEYLVKAKREFLNSTKEVSLSRSISINSRE